MDRKHRQEAHAPMRTAFSDAGPRDASRSSLEGSAGPAFHSDVLPDLGRHDEQLAALMSHAQREATQAEPQTSAAHQLAAASVIEGAAAASNTLPASLLELRTPSQLCCWANGCYPLPPVIPVFQQHNEDTPSTKIAIQMPEKAHKRLQEVAGVNGKRVQLRAIAVQSTKVLLDEEAEQPPSGKALWISLPTSDLRTGVVYIYLLVKGGGASAAPQQLTLFASLPMLAVPPAIGAELEDLFGAMIQELCSREETEGSSSTYGSERGGEGGSNGGSDGGSSADCGRRGRLQRCLSAPVVSIHRQRAPSPAGGNRWRDRVQCLSMRSADEPMDRNLGSNISAGGPQRPPREAFLSFPMAVSTAGEGSSTTGTMHSPASTFNPELNSRLPPASPINLFKHPPWGRFSLDNRYGFACTGGSNVLDPGCLSDSLDDVQQTSLSCGNVLDQPPTSAGVASTAGNSQQAVKTLPLSPRAWPDQLSEQRKELAPAGLEGAVSQTNSVPGSVPLSPNLPVHQPLPGGPPNIKRQAALPSGIAETVSTQLASLATLDIPPASCAVSRSAASACNLALSLLSCRSPSVRSVATSVHDGFSSYAGLIAVSKRMHVYASSAPLVAATYSTHFGPLSADLGYVLETAERCVAIRTQGKGAQASPGGVLVASLGVDIPLLAETIEDMSHLFNNQRTILCLELLQTAVEKLEGAAI